MASRIVFLAVPPSLAADIAEHGPERFTVDPSIPLPVEVENADDGRGDDGGGAEENIPGRLAENLSWEMILSGMIRVVSAPPGTYDTQPHWIEYFRRFVLAAKPDIYREFTAAALTKAKNGDFAMALEICAVLEGLFPHSPGAALSRALILEAQAEAPGGGGAAANGGEGGGGGIAGVEEAALAAWEKALAFDPVPPDALLNGGFFFAKRGDYRRARECLTAYLPLAAGATGNDEKNEKQAQAEALIQEIERKGLDNEGFMEAVALIRAGRDSEALPRIRGFIEERPRVWNGWFVLGWALRKLNRFSDGLEAFKKAAELGGASADLHNETAICLMELGRYEPARRELEAALRGDSENVKIISNLGVLALKQGNEEEAAGFFRTVLELDPADPVAQSCLRGF